MKASPKTGNKTLAFRMLNMEITLEFNICNAKVIKGKGAHG